MKYTFTRSICYFVFFSSLASASAQPVLNYTSIVSGLNFPVDFVSAPEGNGHFYIVEQGGLIKFYNGTTTSTFLDLSAVISPSVITSIEERGLLSMAFHPDFDGVTNRYFFVYYTTTSSITGTTTVTIARYRTQVGNPNLGDPSAPDQVIAIDKPLGQTNHNGGKLNFGTDGMLYFATGDGGGSNDPLNNAQDVNSLLGKMLRIDINGTDEGFYSIPPDNPYVNMVNKRGEIWAIGLRNPFRWSFDPVTNAMWIGDVGQLKREEVDVRLPNLGPANYGWPCFEGTRTNTEAGPNCDPPDDILPFYDYTHDYVVGGFAITGGYVYRGTTYPSLYGYYVFADYISGNVWVMDLSGTVTQQTTDLIYVAGFGVDENREIYAVTRATSAGAGAIYRVGANFPLPSTLISFTGRTIDGYNELRWSTSYEQNADRYLIEYSTDGSNFTVAGEVAATNSLSGHSYTYRHAITDTRKIFYRLKMRDLDASSRYSSVIVIGGKNNSEIRLYPTLVKNNMIELNSNTPVENLSIYDQAGRQMYRNNLNGRQGYFSIQLPTLGRGIYFVTLQGKDYHKTEKIIIQ